MGQDALMLQVVVGVLACPNLSQTSDGRGPPGCLFTAIQGQGAFLSPLFGEPEHRPILAWLIAVKLQQGISLRITAQCEF